MKIEAISKKNYGIKFKGKWYTVIGNARKYIDKLNKGDDIKVNFNDDNDIIYIKKNDSGMEDRLDKIEKEMHEKLGEIKGEIEKLVKKLDSILNFKDGNEVEEEMIKNGKE